MRPRHTVSILGHETRALEHPDVLLHRGEAHRVEARQGRDRVLPAHRARHDVTAGGVGECVEEAVGPLLLLIYNHMVSV
jgi:hypothetical protein